ncbi:MAG: DUF805 domain-containing protein [Leucobacter sp.]
MTHPPTPDANNNEGEQTQGSEPRPDESQTQSAAAPPPPPQYGAPQYGTPQYGAPQQGAGQPYGAGQQQYGAPQYNAQQPYGAPQYNAQQPYGAPQYGAPQQGYVPQYPAASSAYAGPGGPFDGATHPDDLNRPLYGASFAQAVKRFFKNYAKFSGRASRSEYWWIVLFIFLVQLVPLILYISGIIVAATSAATSYDPYANSYSDPTFGAGSGAGLVLLFVGVGLLILIFLAILVPSIAVMWRRLHDGGFAGPLYFLSFVPYVGGIVLLIFSLMPPKTEGRRYDQF